MTNDIAAELEQFFWYLKGYASGEREALSKTLKAGQADALKASDFLPDLKKWESNFKKAIELIETDPATNNSK